MGEPLLFLTKIYKYRHQIVYSQDCDIKNRKRKPTVFRFYRHLTLSRRYSTGKRIMPSETGPMIRSRTLTLTHRQRSDLHAVTSGRYYQDRLADSNV